MDWIKKIDFQMCFVDYVPEPEEESSATQTADIPDFILDAMGTSSVKGQTGHVSLDPIIEHVVRESPFKTNEFWANFVRDLQTAAISAFYNMTFESDGELQNAIGMLAANIVDNLINSYRLRGALEDLVHYGLNAIGAAFREDPYAATILGHDPKHSFSSFSSSLDLVFNGIRDTLMNLATSYLNGVVQRTETDQGIQTSVKQVDLPAAQAELKQAGLSSLAQTYGDPEDPLRGAAVVAINTILPTLAGELSESKKQEIVKKAREITGQNIKQAGVPFPIALPANLYSVYERFGTHDGRVPLTAVGLTPDILSAYSQVVNRFLKENDRFEHTWQGLRRGQIPSTVLEIYMPLGDAVSLWGHIAPYMVATEGIMSLGHIEAMLDTMYQNGLIPVEMILAPWAYEYKRSLGSGEFWGGEGRRTIDAIWQTLKPVIAGKVLEKMATNPGYKSPESYFLLIKDIWDAVKDATVNLAQSGEGLVLDPHYFAMRDKIFRAEYLSIKNDNPDMPDDQVLAKALQETDKIMQSIVSSSPKIPATVLRRIYDRMSSPHLDPDLVTKAVGRIKDRSSDQTIPVAVGTAKILAVLNNYPLELLKKPYKVVQKKGRKYILSYPKDSPEYQNWKTFMENLLHTVMFPTYSKERLDRLIKQIRPGETIFDTFKRWDMPASPTDEMIAAIYDVWQKYHDNPDQLAVDLGLKSASELSVPATSSAPSEQQAPTYGGASTTVNKPTEVAELR